MYNKYATLRDKAGVTDYGVYNPKVDKLKTLADYFGVSIEYFLSDAEQEVV